MPISTWSMSRSVSIIAVNAGAPSHFADRTGEQHPLVAAAATPGATMAGAKALGIIAIERNRCGTTVR
jgi:hypothetical protein